MLTPSQRKTTSRRFVETILNAALSVLQLEGYYVELDVVTDAQIRSVNKKHRSKDKPTDVLSFPTYEGKNGRLKVPKWEVPPFHLGSIVIAVGVAKRQAQEFAHPLHHEMARLIVHGVCHLAGYDHERSARDEKAMFAIEDKILDRLRAKRIV